MEILPNTASACEHYAVRSADKTALIAFPQRGMIDLPGGLEIQVGNRAVSREGPDTFGFSPDDLPSLGGIRDEHRSFLRALSGEAQPPSSLRDTLDTQIIRDELLKLTASGAGGTVDVEFG